MSARPSPPDRHLAPNASNLHSLLFRKPQSVKRGSALPGCKPNASLLLSKVGPPNKSRVGSQVPCARASSSKKVVAAPRPGKPDAPASPFNLSAVQNLVFESQMDLLNRVIAQQRAQEIELAQLREKLRLVGRHNNRQSEACKENSAVECPLSRTSTGGHHDFRALGGSWAMSRGWEGPCGASPNDLRESISDLRDQVAQLRVKNEATIRLFSPPGDR